jgi:probable HAF family extracellular repeat protein
MKKAMGLFFAAVGMTLCVTTAGAAANSITYTVGGWRVTVTDLGLLPGGTASRALAINNLGQIVGLATDSGFALHRPLWDANTGAIIGIADNFDPASTAIPEHRNDNGEMAGTESINQNLYRGVYWNSTGQAFGLPPMAGVDPLYGSVHVKAHGINNLGQIVGMSKESAPNYYVHAVLWQNKDTPPLDLGFLGKGAYGIDYSEAYGINDLSHVVGVGTVGSLRRAFLWRNGLMIDLGALSGQISAEASAVNNTGAVVGKSNFYPVMWRYNVTNLSSAPAIQQLPIPSGFFSAAPTAVNDSSDVAGYAGTPNIDAHAILWRNGQAINLGVWPGGHYSVASGINNLGAVRRDQA